MQGLTAFGIFHTLISLVAVIAGVVSFIRQGRISAKDGWGKSYVIFTLASCVTALFIFRHGGFGPPHALAIITLATLGIAACARVTSIFGRAARYVETLSYSATFLFHMIPAVTETSTRFPAGAPLVASADSPALKTAYLAFLVVFLLGAVAQSVKLRNNPALGLR